MSMKYEVVKIERKHPDKPAENFYYVRVDGQPITNWTSNEAEAITSMQNMVDAAKTVVTETIIKSEVI